MRAGKYGWMRWEIAVIVIAVAVAVAFAAALVVIAATRPLTPLEAVLFQIIALGVGLGGGLLGSYKFGQHTAANKQYARSALRSVMVLFRSLVRSYEAMEALKNGNVSEGRLADLQRSTADQMDIAYSVMNDWRDLIPEEFDNVGENLDRPEN